MADHNAVWPATATRQPLRRSLYPDLGDQPNEWAVPLADDLYDEYLRELGEEGLI